MTEQTTLQTLQNKPLAKANDAPMTLLTGAGFDQLQRVAKALSSSTLVPAQYRAFTEVKDRGKVTGYTPNGAGLPNCIVALNMAQRMNADPLMIMQNLHIIEGRPSWSSPFIIAAINSCGRFSPLRFEISEPGEPTEVTYSATVWKAGNRTEEKRKVTVRHQTCRAWVIEKETGDRLDGPLISIQMAIDEGWLTKNGSKWQTMPEMMLRYRSASFLGRLYAPELLMGLQTREEVEDFIQAERDETGTYTVSSEDIRNAEPMAPSVPAEDDKPLPGGWEEILSDEQKPVDEPAEAVDTAPTNQNDHNQEQKAGDDAGELFGSME